jgi:hypothetical protein
MGDVRLGVHERVVSWGCGSRVRGSDGSSDLLSVEVFHTLETRVGNLRDRRAVHNTRSNGQPRASHNPGSQFRDGNPLQGIGLENSLENRVQPGRQRQNGPQKLAVLEVGTVRAIRLGSPLPWIPATGKIYQDDTEGPHIIRGGRVAICCS